MATAVVGSIAELQIALVKRIGEPRYEMWFHGHTRFQATDDRLIVGVPNLYFQEWLQKTFGKALDAAARETFGKGYEVKFKIDPELFRSARAEQEEAKKHPPHDDKPKPVIDLPPAPPPRVRLDAKKRKKGSPTPSMFAESSVNSYRKKPTRRWLDLKDFVVGPCNRVAFAAAQSIVEEPDQGINPLVIHGPIGTGKTHLLEGIFAALKRRDPSLTIRHVSAEEFTNRFVMMMKGGKLGTFRRQFRDCDVLLLDNLHFLSGKKATEEEFLHTFDVLASAGKQVVVSTDCHPRLAEGMLPEMVDRLLGGTSWSLQPPDPKTRLEILRAKSTGPGPTIPEDVLKDLAGQLRGNVRELEGAVRCLKHYAKVEGRPIDLAMAYEALGDLLRHAKRVVGLEDIDAALCQVIRLKPGTLQSKARAWSVSHPRMVAIYLARKHTAASYSEIGKHFGGRNHSTAVAAEKKVRQWLESSATLPGGSKPWKVRELVEAVERALGLV